MSLVDIGIVFVIWTWQRSSRLEKHCGKVLHCYPPISYACQISILRGVIHASWMDTMKGVIYPMLNLPSEYPNNQIWLMRCLRLWWYPLKYDVSDELYPYSYVSYPFNVECDLVYDSNSDMSRDPIPCAMSSTLVSCPWGTHLLYKMGLLYEMVFLWVLLDHAPWSLFCVTWLKWNSLMKQRPSGGYEM